MVVFRWIWLDFYFSLYNSVWLLIHFFHMVYVPPSKLIASRPFVDLWPAASTWKFRPRSGNYGLGLRSPTKIKSKNPGLKLPISKERPKERPKETRDVMTFSISPIIRTELDVFTWPHFPSNNRQYLVPYRCMVLISLRLRLSGLKMCSGFHFIISYHFRPVNT